MSNSEGSITYTPDSHPQLWLPQDPFPYPFEELGYGNNLKSYLKVVREHPAYAEPTHAAFYRLVIRLGLNCDRAEALMRKTGKEIPAYNAFTPFFGIEEYIHSIMNGYGYQAAEGGRTRKKMLTLTGSPGAGKSDFVNHVQYNIMHQREPIPCLAGSPMWSNPLNALYLPKLIAARKSGRRRAKMMDELVGIIERLDFSGPSALDFGNSDVQKIARRHGFKPEEVLSAAQLAQIIMTDIGDAKGERDFVALVCYGLGQPKATLDALVFPDPWAQDVVIGEFAGAAFINKQLLVEAGTVTLTRAAASEVVGKGHKDAGYGQFDPALAIDLADFPLDNMFMSEGQGIVDVSEIQPINFDLKVWRGDTNIGALGLYDDRDPRSVNPSGVFNKGKFIVLTEVFRNPDEGFRVLLEGLEGQRLSLPEPLSSFHQQGVGWEGMIWGHSNDEQWNKFYADPAHRAHNDRFYWQVFKYPDEPSEAAKVTQKLFGATRFGKPVAEGGCHHEPLVETYTGFFRVATHLDWASKGNIPFIAVLNGYNGSTLRLASMSQEINLQSLREQASFQEGLDGMSPREMDDILGQLAAKAKAEHERGLRSCPCFTVSELRDTLIDRFKKDPRIPAKIRDKWIGWLQLPLEKELRRRELSRVYKAAFIPSFRDLCQNFYRRYMQYLKALARGTARSGSSLGQQYMTTQGMETFLQEIERADTMSVNSAQGDKFRVNVLVAEREWKEQFGSVEPPYDVHEGLKRCIESYVLRQAKDITGVIGLTNLTKEEKERLDSAKARLVAEHGYCDHCAEKLLVEVGTTRDFLIA